MRLLVVLAVTVAVLLTFLTVRQRALLFDGAAPVPPVGTLIPEGVDVEVPTHDGLAIPAWYVPAAGDDTTGERAVLILHGQYETRAARADLARRLSAAGWHVLLPEYRGYGDAPGSPTEPGLTADAEAAVARLAELSGVPVATVDVVGISLGTGVAAQVAARRELGRLVLVTPYTSLPDVAWERLPGVPYRLLMWDEFDSLGVAAAIDEPVVVVGAERDTVVPPAHAGLVADALGAGLITVPRVDHDLGGRTSELVLDALGRLDPR